MFSSRPAGNTTSFDFPRGELPDQLCSGTAHEGRSREPVADRHEFPDFSRVDKSVNDFPLGHRSCFRRRLTRRSVMISDFHRDSCTETDADDYN